MSETSFDSLAEALQAAGSSCGPAEAHGGLCGSLCAAGPDAGSRWLKGCMPEPGARPLSAPLRAWCEETWGHLSAGALEFELMMPDEDEALAMRVRELAMWCHGFLAGLGAEGLALEGDRVPEPLNEIVGDFLEISRADAGEDTAPAEAEFDFAELIEYVRVSVQIVFEELAGLREQTRTMIH